MTPSRTVEQRLAALEDALQPQALRNSLERTWDPRGGEPRIIDSTGHTLDFQGAIQFLNATATVDPVLQRVIVTPAGGGGGASYRFSDTLPSTAPDERIDFMAESGPAVPHLRIDTGSAGTTRLTQIVTAEDATTPAGGVGATVMSADATGGTGAFEGIAEGDGTATSQLLALNLSTGAQAACVANTAPAGASFAALQSPFASIQAATGVTLQAVGLSVLTAAVVARTVYDQDSASNFIQAEADTTVADAVPRVMRGPFTVSVAALAAGASTTGALTNARNGTDYVVVGGPTGAAGSELLQWSWADSGANDVTIQATNAGLVAAITATLSFYVVSTS